jgi:hypothetical protein
VQLLGFGPAHGISFASFGQTPLLVLDPLEQFGGQTGRDKRANSAGRARD